MSELSDKITSAAETTENLLGSCEGCGSGGKGAWWVKDDVELTGVEYM